MTMQTGLEVLRESGYDALKGKRVGLLTNPSGVDRQLVSTYEILWRAAEVNLVALFAPEHGFAGALAEGEQVDTQTDPRTGLPVYSLYGDTLRPTPQMLDNIDVIVCDIQDIGLRYYTFSWTVSLVLEAAGAQGVEVVILDRPNPLGGEVVAGPGLNARMASFVGRYPVPVQHGLTLGEMGQLLNGVYNPTPVALSVIPCAGWTRGMTWAQTGLPWVAPSPNMPQLSTLQQYAGACLVEGTNLSEGRGTALPFEVVGAPFVDGPALADVLNAQGWPGVRFRPHRFSPTTSKWAGQECGGVQVHVVDLPVWRPVETWLGIIRMIRQLCPGEFAWLPAHFDRLIGSGEVRAAIEAGLGVEEIGAGWADFCASFRKQRAAYLLYGSDE